MSVLAGRPGEGGSGILPAASVSNIDSASKSLVRTGAGGKGLLMSESERASDGELGLKFICGIPGPTAGGELSGFGVGSPFSSTWINFPCFE